MSSPHLTLMLMIVGCRFLVPEVSWSVDFNLEQDIVYRQAGEVELKLDIAFPVDRSDLCPALVYIFDSDWGYFDGGKSQCLVGIVSAAKRGYVGVAIEYRQTTMEEGRAKYRFPDQVYDVKCAIRWLRANEMKYRINSEAIGVVGFCCGGHLALLIGLTRPLDGLEGNCSYADYSSRVQAVVSSAGLTELSSLVNGEHYWVPAAITAFIGGSPREKTVEYAKASPATYVYRDSPPILTIHGEIDGDIPIEQAFLLDEKMREVGASHTLVIRKDEGHIDFTSEPEVFDFFDKYLKKQH
jgi:acetyl esterase/lipase